MDALGIDVLLSAKRVGASGYAYGLDMTDEMLKLARKNAAEAGATNVEFMKGTIESIPLRDASVDVVISNCVVNLAADKSAVFGEVARVLRPGGRIGITDIVAEDHLTPEQRAERGDYVGCIAGALSISEFREGLQAVGLTDVVVEPTHAVADGMHSAIIRAAKPAEAAPRRHTKRACTTRKSPATKADRMQGSCRGRKSSAIKADRMRGSCRGRKSSATKAGRMHGSCRGRKAVTSVLAVTPGVVGNERAVVILSDGSWASGSGRQ